MTLVLFQLRRVFLAVLILAIMGFFTAYIIAISGEVKVCCLYILKKRQYLHYDY